METIEELKAQIRKLENQIDELQHDFAVIEFAGVYMDKDDAESMRTQEGGEAYNAIKTSHAAALEEERGETERQRDILQAGYDKLQHEMKRYPGASIDLVDAVIEALHKERSRAERGVWRET